MNTENLISEIQERISYRFRHIVALKTALTHSSYANEKKKQKLKYNERLEFLGDSVLGIIISDYLFRNCPNRPEGELTKMRAMIVCERALAMGARSIDLGKYMYLGKGEENTGGRDRESILADGFEAMIGAIYLDSGINSAKKFVLKTLREVIDRVIAGEGLFTDHKTQFQEVLQKYNKGKIQYRIKAEEGPDHNKTFYTDLYVDDYIYGTGAGRSKKESEQNAAKSALDRMVESE